MKKSIKKNINSLKNLNSSDSIFLIAKHRFDFIFYLRLLENYKKKDLNFLLLVDKKLYKEKAIKKFLYHLNIEFILMPAISRNLNNIAQTSIDIIKFKLWISKLPRNNLSIILDKSDIISRIFLKSQKNILLIQQIENFSSNYKVNLRSTFFYLILSFLLKAKIMIYYDHKYSAKHVKFLKFLPFNKPKNVLYLTNKKKYTQSIYLPHLKNLKKNKKIVIFGSRFNDWRAYESYKNDFQKDIVLIYEKIAKKFNKNYEIDYIPHPKESNYEFNLINKIFDKRIYNRKNQYFSSEHYLINNKDVSYTYSIGSTSSLSSHDMGFTSKVFYKMLKIDKKLQRVFEDIFHAMPHQFFVKNYKELFTNYKPQDRSNLIKFNKIL